MTSLLTRRRASTDTGASDGPLVKVSGLRKSYTRPGGEIVNAVDGIDLEINTNEIVALVGPSGCGKTTLLRCIAGLETPTHGTIQIAGRTVFDAGKRRPVPPEKRGIGMMFQSYAVWPHMSVAQNVAYPLRASGIGKRDAMERVRNILDIVGIPELFEQMPHALSGGQQQRVALARSLVNEPSVLLFDEPLSNVDAKVRENLRREILAMHRRLGFAALYVTHDQDEAMQIGQRLAVLDSGSFAQSGRPADVYRRPANRYVADFVGQVNEWKGTLASNHGALEVRSATATIVADSENISPDCVVGTECIAIVRPELIDIAESASGTGHPGASHPNTFGGTVTATMFHGAYTEYLVELDGDEIMVWSSTNQGIEVGRQVRVGFSERDVRIVAA